MERKVIRSAKKKSYAARTTKYKEGKVIRPRFSAVGCGSFRVTTNMSQWVS